MKVLPAKSNWHLSRSARARPEAQMSISRTGCMGEGDGGWTVLRVSVILLLIHNPEPGWKFGREDKYGVRREDS
eukprot:1325354-Amorphochlora_amoeboformis.AAC.1